MQTARLNRRYKAVEPTTLADSVLHAEHARNAARLAEIKGMASKLRLLDAYMPAIRAAGINVHGDEVRGWSGRSVYISSPILNGQRNATLEKVLREQGMRETKRTQYSDNSYTVQLTKGHLTVNVDVRLPQKPKEATGATA